MTLPYLYMRRGHFCQMFMTNGDATLSGKPIRLQAELNSGDCLSPLELCQYILAKGVRKHGSKALF